MDKNYPRVKYHYQQKAVVVKNAQEEAALGPDWYNSPADAKPPEPKVESKKPGRPKLVTKDEESHG